MVTLVLCAVLAADEGDVRELQADAPVVSNRPVESMSLSELKVEYSLLEEQRPGIGGPIAMLATGAGMLFYGTLMFFISATSSPQGVGSLFSGASAPVGILFATMLVAGAGLLLPGIWLLKNRLPDRAIFGARMDEVNAQIEAIDRARPQLDEEAPRYGGEQREPTPQEQRAAETYQL